MNSSPTSNSHPGVIGSKLEQALIKAGVSRAQIEITLQRRALTQESLTDIMRPGQYGFLTPEKLARVQAETAGFEYFSAKEIEDIDASAVSKSLLEAGITIERQESLLLPRPRQCVAA